MGLKEDMEIVTRAGSTVKDALTEAANFFAMLGTDGPNNHDQGPEPAILDAQGKYFVHPGTGGLYQVQGHGWDAERERWMLRYVKQALGKDGDAKRSGAAWIRVDYFHLPEDFFRKGRFIEVKS